MYSKRVAGILWLYPSPQEPEEEMRLLNKIGALIAKDNGSTYLLFKQDLSEDGT